MEVGAVEGGTSQDHSNLTRPKTEGQGRFDEMGITAKNENSREGWPVASS